MHELDRQLSEIQLAAPARCPIDHLSGNLGGESKGVRGGSARRHNVFAALRGQLRDQPMGGRRMSSEPARHRRDVHAPAGSEELPSPRKPRERLIHSGAGAEMQQHLGAHRRSLGECVRPLKNGFCQAFHHVTVCQDYTLVSDTFTGADLVSELRFLRLLGCLPRIWPVFTPLPAAIRKEEVPDMVCLCGCPHL